MAIERRNTVINQMIKYNYVTEKDGAGYKVRPIDLSNYKKVDENNGLAPSGTFFAKICANGVRITKIRLPENPTIFMKTD